MLKLLETLFVKLLSTTPALHYCVYTYILMLLLALYCTYCAPTPFLAPPSGALVVSQFQDPAIQSRPSVTQVWLF